MPHPDEQEPSPNRPSGVDDMIQEARSSSWRLPDVQSAELRTGAANPSPAARWAPPRPASTATHAGSAHPADLGSAHLDPAPHAGAVGHGPSGSRAASAGHGTAHDAGPPEEPLGPVDVEMWGAGVLATAIGLFMAVCFVLATSGSGAY